MEKYNSKVPKSGQPTPVTKPTMKSNHSKHKIMHNQWAYMLLKGILYQLLIRPIDSTIKELRKFLTQNK